MFRKGFKSFFVCMVIFVALFFTQFSCAIGPVCFNNSISAKAASYTLSVNENTLTISGTVADDNEMVQLWSALKKLEGREKITEFKANPDFVLPKNSSYLFNGVFTQKLYPEIETIDLSEADYSNVENMSLMFGKANAETITVTVPSTCVQLTSLFKGCSNLRVVNAKDWDTSNVVYFSEMVTNCTNLKTVYGISDWNTNSLCYSNDMFNGCSNIKELDISGWNTSNVQRMEKMFYGCADLERITVSDKWSVKSVYSSNNMFSGCTSLVGGNGTEYDANYVDATYACIDDSGKPGYLTGPKSDVRTEISEIEATSKDISEIPAYGKEIKRPTITVTKGEPAYFNISYGNGYWHKYDESSDTWVRVSEGVFEEGKYHFVCQIRIDDGNESDYVLDVKGVSVKVNGASWEVDEVADYGFSYVWVTSPEFVVKAPNDPDDPDEPTEPEKPVEGNKVEDTKAPAVANEASHKVGDVVTGGGATYEITSVDEGKLSATFKKNDSAKATSVTVPATITVDNKEYKVTEIAANAFANNKKLKKITIGSNIQKIGKKAFFKCKNLKTVTIKTTLLTKSSVGGSAFKGIHANAKVKVPKKVLKSYQKVLKSRGINGKTQKIK